jgi:hypothetical protein
MVQVLKIHYRQARQDLLSWTQGRVSKCPASLLANELFPKLQLI